MSPCGIRPFRPEDRAALVRLWSEVFADDPPRNEPSGLIDQKLSVQPELLLIAEESGRLIGAVMAGFDGTRGWIHHLAVDPAYRYRGIGTSLMEAAMDGLRVLGCPKVNLQVRARNSDAVAFYRTLGFQVEDHVSMGKLLTGDAR